MDVLWQAVPNKPLSEEFQREIVSRVTAVAPASKSELHPAPVAKRPVALRSGSLAGQIVRSPVAQALLAFAAGILCMIFVAPGEDSGEVVNEPPALMNGATVNLASPQIPATLHMSEKKYERTQLVSLRRKPDSSELRGHVLWDALTREIHIFCHGLQPPPSGSQYAMWLVGPGVEVRAAERLEVDSQGVCKAAVHWPEGDFRFVKVTLEKSSQLKNKPSSEVALTSNSIVPLTY